MSEEKEYSLGVWECLFYMSDGAGGYLQNPDGSVKLFDGGKDFSWSHIAEYVDEEDLVAVPEEQKVLLVTLEEINGEREYTHQCYFENSDEENKPSDMYILEQFFGDVALDKDDLADRKELMGEEDYLSGEFWTNDCQRLVSVYSFQMVSEKEIEVLKKLTCVPLINEEDK